MAEVQTLDGGALLLVENHCPICEAAAECQGICAIELEVFSEVLGTQIRVERTDHNACTGGWAVLDYKTGSAVASPEKAHRKGREGDREWVDLQLPLYRRLLPGIMNEQGRPLIDMTAVEHGKLYFGYISLPKNTEDCEFMLADWSEEDFTSAEATAREAVKRLRVGKFEYDRTVTKVRWHGQDALKPLLTEGWQDVSDDADAAAFEDAGGEEERVE